jgi:flagellar protein FlbD
MIQVETLDHSNILLNAELIEHIEETPETLIVLITGESFRVVESASEVLRRIIEYRRSLGGPAAARALDGIWHAQTEAPHGHGHSNR